MVKLPRDPRALVIDDADLADWPHHRLVRIHGTIGPHTLPWYRLRHFTALAEVFQPGRVVEPAAPNGPYLTIWTATRILRLLDVRGTWPLRNGASHAINTGPHPVCWRWSQAIAVHPHTVDGLLYTSSMTSSDATALFLPAADSFPANPELSLPLSDPGLAGALHAAAERIGYTIT